MFFINEKLRVDKIKIFCQILFQKIEKLNKSYSNVSSSIPLPNKLSTFDRKLEVFNGINIENSLPKLKKLKTLSTSNSTVSVQFDSTIKKLKTKLFEVQHKKAPIEMHISNPQEVTEEENMLLPVDVPSVASSHDFSRTEQHEVASNMTQWKTLGDKISNTLNHLSTISCKDPFSLEIKTSCEDKTHNFVEKYKNRVKLLKKQNLGGSIDASNTKLKSLKKIIFMNKAAGILGPVKNGILAKAKEIINLSDKSGDGAIHRKNSKSTVIMLKKKATGEHE